MLIVCPNCSVSYQVEPDSLDQDGRAVRCASCRHVWISVVPAFVSDLGEADPWDAIDIAPGETPSDSRPDVAFLPDTAPEEFAAPGDIDVAALSSEIEHKRTDIEPGVAFVEGALDDPAEQTAPPVPSRPAAPAARRHRRDGLLPIRWLRPSLSAVILVLLAMNAALLTWRQNIVQLLPQTASLYAAVGLPVNLRGLAFDNVRMSRVEQDGVGVLVIEGTVSSVTNRPVEVPRLRLALHNEAKREVYAWTAAPSRSILAPGDAMPFQSRLASPPADAREIQIRFSNPHDVMAGLN